MTTVIQPFPFFADLGGDPLDEGYIYIGLPNQNPETSPKQAYWDAALTIPATQPLRTLEGYIARNGAPARVFVNGEFSMTVRNKRGSLVYTVPSVTSILSADQITADDGASGSLWTTVQGALTYLLALVSGFFARTRVFYNAGDNGTIDRTVALQALVSTGCNVRILGGQTIRVSDWINMESNQTIYVDAGAQINQVTADRGIFRATNKTMPQIVNNGILYGPGVWSPSWSSNGAHQERGVMFRGCTDATLDGAGVIRNFGHAQFAVLGGSFRGNHRLEGTQGYGSVSGSSPAIVAGDNWQMGLYVTDDDTYGPLISGKFVGRVSGVCQGALRENREAGAPSLVNAGLLELDMETNSIPGQHFIYVQRGNLKANLRAKGVALAVCKISTPIANAMSSNHECDVVCEDVGSHMFEVEATTTTGTNANLNLRGVGSNIRGAGLSILNGVKSLRADIVVEDALLGFQAQGVNQTDVDVTINGRKIGQSGVAIYSTNSDFRVRPVLRECNDDNTATDSGILVSSASATVDLYDPVCTDTNTRQKYALWNLVAGSVVRVHGRPVFSGTALADVRATGVITQWPTESVLNVDRVVGPNKVSSPLAMRTTCRSTSASSAILWMREMPDESAFSVRATITGKLENSTQRAVYVVQALFFRDAGGVCTQQGTTQVITSVVSGSFAGAYALQSNGANDIVLLVNSGGTANYDWTARVEVETLST